MLSIRGTIKYALYIFAFVCAVIFIGLTNTYACYYLANKFGCHLVGPDNASWITIALLVVFGVACLYLIVMIILYSMAIFGNRVMFTQQLLFESIINTLFAVATGTLLGVAMELWRRLNGGSAEGLFPDPRVSQDSATAIYAFGWLTFAGFILLVVIPNTGDYVSRKEYLAAYGV